MLFDDANESYPKYRCKASKISINLEFLYKDSDFNKKKMKK